MKLPYKILLFNIGLALLLAFLIGKTLGSDGIPAGYGIVSLFEGIICLIAGIILLFKTDKRYAQGFLLSAAFLMLTGFITCSTML